MRQYPELEKVCTNLLPPSAQRQDNGIAGGGGRGVSGAAQRALTKREGEEFYNENRGEKKTYKATDRAHGVAETTRKCMSEAVGQLIPLLQNSQPEESKWRQRTEEATSKSAAIALSEDIVTAHMKFEERLDEEVSKPNGGNRLRIKFLKSRMAALEKEMEKDDF